MKSGKASTVISITEHSFVRTYLQLIEKIELWRRKTKKGHLGITSQR